MSAWQAAAVALAIGLLVGSERERSAHGGLDAGVRTFALAALAGCLSGIVGPYALEPEQADAVRRLRATAPHGTAAGLCRATGPDAAGTGHCGRTGAGRSLGRPAAVVLAARAAVPVLAHRPGSVAPALVHRAGCPVAVSPTG